MGVTCQALRAGAATLLTLTLLGAPAFAAPPDAQATDAAPSLPSDAVAPKIAAPDAKAAIAAALPSALGAFEFKTSPVGAGDWSGATKALHDFYAGRNFAPVWVDDKGLTASGQALLARLLRADEDALDLSAFALPKKPLTDASPADLAAADATLSAAAVAYAMQASGSRIAPTSISHLITAHPGVAAPGAALAALAAAADPDAALEGYNPQQKGYRALRDQLAQARAPASEPSDPAPVADAAPSATRIPDGPSLGLGMHDPRVPLVRARLNVPANGSAADVYDLPLAAAVQAFQRANGMAPNGALTPGTAAALSGGVATPAVKVVQTVSPAHRAAMIAANMEMWRWEPHDMGGERIEVNIPDFSLRVMDGDNLIHASRVIVGKPDTPTPVFSNSVKYILLNPIWRVPDSIIKKEFAPHLADDPNYLTDRGYEVKEIGGRMVVDQPPGEANALGHIVFMFPNEHDVYLHDTPSRALFGAAHRALSHGCVRVEQPMALAQLVMGASWTSARLQSMIGGSDEHTVMLPHPIPIHLEYFTEFVDASGALQDRDDIYGIATRVAGTIAKSSQD